MSFYICRACDKTHDYSKLPPCSSLDCWSCEDNHPWRHTYQPISLQPQQQQQDPVPHSSTAQSSPFGDAEITISKYHCFTCETKHDFNTNPPCWFGPRGCWRCEDNHPLDHPFTSIACNKKDYPDPPPYETTAPKRPVRLPTKSKFIEPDPVEDVHEAKFPGKGAKFIWKHGDWAPRTEADGDLACELHFSSRTEGSLFTKFALLGYKDGSIVLLAHFHRDNIDLLRQYLKKIGMDPEDADIIYKSIKVYNHNDIKLLFTALALHNEIPDKYFDLIRSVVEKGTWM